MESIFTLFVSTYSGSVGFGSRVTEKEWQLIKPGCGVHDTILKASIAQIKAFCTELRRMEVEVSHPTQQDFNKNKSDKECKLEFVKTSQGHAD